MLVSLATVLPTAALIVLMPADPAQRQDPCASVAEAIAAAPTQFESLRRGAEPGVPDMYMTSWRLPGTTDDDCMIMFDEYDGYDVSCGVSTISYETAKAKAQAWAVEVERCLTSRGRFIGKDWAENNGSTRMGSFRRFSKEFFVPTSQPANDVRIRVSGGCSTGRRGERCSAQMVVELTGDER